MFRPRPLTAILAALVLSGGPYGCALVGGLDRYHEAPASDLDATGMSDVTDASRATDATEASSGRCPTADVKMAPTMVAVTTDGGAFCIDSTEVTVGQFLQFRNAVPQPSFSGPCAWKTSATDPEIADQDFPVVKVDWCDALAFCASVDRRLCKQRYGEALNSSQALSIRGEWEYACTSGGTLKFPYGPTRDDGKGCYLPGQDGGPALRAVQTDVACVGPAGVFDLSGNAWEWEDACDPAPDGGLASQDLCSNRSGRDGDGTCAAQQLTPRNVLSGDIGFRCCADAR